MLPGTRTAFTISNLVTTRPSSNLLAGTTYSSQARSFHVASHPGRSRHLLIQSPISSWAEDGVTADSVLIGQSAALAGPAAQLGLHMQAGMNAAFAEANAAGGIHGRNITLISKDDGYNPEKAVDNTFALIDDDMVFCLAGYVGTPTAKEAVPIIEEYEVPLVGLFTGAGFLRQPVKPSVFNVRASYDEETDAIVERLTEDLKISKIAVFHQDDSFGAVGLSGTTKALKKRGLEVVGTGTYTRNTVDVTAGLEAIIAAEPEAVVMVGAYTPLAAFIKQAQAKGLMPSSRQFHLPAPKPSSPSLAAVPKGWSLARSCQIHLTPAPRLWPNSTSSLKASDGGDPSFGKLEGYLTARVLLAGIEAAGADLNRVSFVEASGSLSTDIDGVNVSFSADNHQALNQVWMTQVKNGRAQVVDSISK